jgi:predicted metal-dependent hydrolase
MFGEDYLLGQISYPIQESPDDEQYHYAQRLYVRRFSEAGRKKVNVQIHEDERIEVYVPMWDNPAKMLKAFMEENADTILVEKNRRFDEDTKAVSNAESLTYNSTLPFLGEYLPIRIMEDSDNRDVFIQNGAIYLKNELDDKRIRQALLKLCRNMVYEYFKPKVDHYAKVIGVSYSQLEIDDGRRTWGVFNEWDKSIVLSRRLMMMSESTIDFLIVHELAHGLVFQHSEEHDFEMGKILPDYEERDEAFFETCRTLMEQGWI